MSEPAEKPEGAPQQAAKPEAPISAEARKIAELEAQLKEKESKYLYLYAELENFKKRAIKERSDLMKYGWENLAHDLLEVLDNLERAVGHLPQGADKQLATGLGMILTQLKTALGKQGVSEIVSLKAPFDPNVHEAVAHEPSDKPEGTVIQEHHRGYLLHGRLLRAARVTVSAGNAPK